MDTTAFPFTTSMKDALSMPPFIYPTDDMTGRATPATGALDAPSSACSPMDATNRCASPIDTVVDPTPLTLTTSATSAGC